MNKKELRKFMHEKRNAIYKNISKFNILCDNLQNFFLHFPPFLEAECLCSYAPTKSEININAISQHAWNAGKNVLFPLCSEAEKGIMHFCLCSGFSDLAAGAYGILEPKPRCPFIAEETLNSEKTVVLVPALGFTAQGFRLGYGQGFYDRFLSKIPKAVTVGITFSELINDTIPVEPWDKPVQYLATETGIVKI